MSQRWDVEADCARDDEGRLLADGAEEIDPLPDPNARHRWHYPGLTAEQLDELAYDARQAVKSRDWMLADHAPRCRDLEQEVAKLKEKLRVVRAKLRKRR